MASIDYPCPSCGFEVFSEPPGSYNICPLCGWEDDHVQLKRPAMAGGANKLSLVEHQRVALSKFPLQQQQVQSYIRAKLWRPLLSEECEPYIGLTDGPSYFLAATEEAPSYYWHQLLIGSDSLAHAPNNLQSISIDCGAVHSEASFWDAYILATKPDDTGQFGRNLDAFWDGLNGGPGWPGECQLQFINTSNLHSFRGGVFFEALRDIANRSTLVKITFE